MTPENFVYWLQGFFEIAKPIELNEGQINEIKNHISLVLNKVTPPTSGLIPMRQYTNLGADGVNPQIGLYNKNSSYPNPDVGMVQFIQPCKSC